MNFKKVLLVGALLLGSLTANAAITDQQARDIVLKEVPNGEITKFEKEYDHGRAVYEIEVMDGNIERDFDIDAETGTILKACCEHKHHHKKHHMKHTEPKLSYEQAKQIALKNSKNGVFESIELKHKNGVQVYDVEIKEGFADREFLIDANTGTILRNKRDF